MRPWTWLTLGGETCLVRTWETKLSCNESIANIMKNYFQSQNKTFPRMDRQSHFLSGWLWLISQIGTSNMLNALVHHSIYVLWITIKLFLSSKSETAMDAMTGGQSFSLSCWLKLTTNNMLLSVKSFIYIKSKANITKKEKFFRAKNQKLPQTDVRTDARSHSLSYWSQLKKTILVAIILRNPKRIYLTNFFILVT